MTFTAEQAADYRREHEEAMQAFDALLLEAVHQGQRLEDGQTKGYVLYGIGRRIKLLNRCLSTIFSLFPPEAIKPINGEDLHLVQVSLHAFVMNLYGTFENLAWAFVSRHGLIDEIGDRKKVGMFLRPTQRFLTEPLRSYLTSETMVKWHTNYLKNYRDALAHRIPLYIPPANYTPEDGKRYGELDHKEHECIAAQRWEELEQVREAKFGNSMLRLLHAFSGEESSRPVYLHPQLICDSRAILEFGSLFFKHWHERA